MGKNRHINELRKAKKTKRCGNCDGTGWVRPIFSLSNATTKRCGVCYGTGHRPAGCYVSTCIVDNIGKKDDCADLTILRNFRDEYLLSTRDGEKMVEDYYSMSPSLLKKLSSHSTTKPLIFTILYDEFLKKIITEIKNDNNKKAISMYKEMILYIENL